MKAHSPQRPTRTMQDISTYLAARPDEAFTARRLRSVLVGHGKIISRALEVLHAEGYITSTIGGTTNYRHYPDLPFYRHACSYTATADG